MSYSDNDIRPSNISFFSAPQLYHNEDPSRVYEPKKKKRENFVMFMTRPRAVSTPLHKSNRVMGKGNMERERGDGRKVTAECLSKTAVGKFLMCSRAAGQSNKRARERTVAGQKLSLTFEKIERETEREGGGLAVMKNIPLKDLHTLTHLQTGKNWNE